MPATAYTANLIAKAAANGSAYQGPATIYLALVTDAPSATVAGTEVDDDDYVRAEVDISAWDDDDAGALSNDVAIEWPEAAADFSGDVEAVEAYTSTDGTTRLWYQILSAPVTFVAGDVPTFAAGELTFSIV